MSGVIARLVLRYVAGALIAAGIITADMGHMISSDPDLMTLVQLALGALSVALAEGWYYLAKRFGWST